jgi:hypothetical protein
MAIKRIQFRDPIPAPIGDGYSREKHAREFDVTEKGAWVFVVPRTPATTGGQRYRIPMSNVVSITEDDIVETIK